MAITYALHVYQGTTLLASGTLTIDTTPPPTATFTPAGGTTVTCSVNSWSFEPNGITDFSFVISGAANGDFPCGPNGSAFTYTFIGRENGNGTDPSGHAMWPNVGGVTWQANVTEDEPISRGTSTS